MRFLVTLVSIITCMLCEYLIARYVLKVQPSRTDSAVGNEYAAESMNLPSGLPLWIVVIGGIVVVAVAKMSFGGMGNNLFNPR